MLELLQGRASGEDSVAREAFRGHPMRQPLQARMERLLDNPDRPEIASWFATDYRGIHVASAFDTPTESSPIGGDFSYRTYFHGGDEDVHPADGHAISRTHLSAVFQSTATGAWKVAISAPVLTPQHRFLGVVALTVELGRLGELLTSKSNPRQFNVLVDGRQGENRGVILQHPLFARILSESRNLDTEFSTSPKYRVPLDSMRPGTIYRDPLGEHPEGARLRRDWIAAKREVKLDPGERRLATGLPQEIDSGLVVLVQEDYDLAAAAVHQLGNSLFRQGILALSSVVAVVVVLWYSVARALGDPNETIRRQGGVRPSPTTIHSMETIELPQALKR